MIFHCGYCQRKKRAGWIGRFDTWDDLIDHLVNAHRWKIVNNKLVREVEDAN